MPRTGPTPVAPLVVKLGGSLFEGENGCGPPQGAMLLALVSRATVPLVIVPGGGAFADTARNEQRRLGLSDPAAHRMALYAMHQMALAIVDRQPEPPRMIVADSARGIIDALGRGRIPVWVPLPMTDSDPGIPEDWSITSDGLAAWLAARIGAREVVLVKSFAGAGETSLAELAGMGAVDPEFARRVAGGEIGWRVLGAGDEAVLATLVGTEMQPGGGRARATTPAEVRRR